jgi:hypothetical protein
MRNNKSCIRFIICHKPVGEEQLIDEATTELIIAAATAAWKTAAGITSTFVQTLVDPYVEVHFQFFSINHKLLQPSLSIVFPSSHSSLRSFLESPQIGCQSLPTEALV